MLVTALARDLYNSIALDRDPDPGFHYVRRRWLVGVFLVIGAVMLGISLRVEPGDTAFYPLTVGLAVVWILGAFVSGPLRLGAYSPTASRPPDRLGAVGLGVVVGLAVGAAFVVGGLLVRMIPGVSDLANKVLAFADYGSLAIVTLITVVNGLAEELFFRGSVYSAARPHNPVLVSTVIYVLVTMASGNVMLGFAGAVLGTVCAILRRSTAGVLAPAITHVIWGAIMVLALPPIFA
ncbi:abortive infection protein [Gordonia alkanivorans CGMCC 6845]|uniref:Abortive infection protein n=1 Tax=Gordonia alkanivorans CGMCC 6845 TaxID=1423140 RepID=W9D7I7_9ACTN|nr:MULTISPECIES: CPBP family intramembrane glutamic endopeptidase [Gordonia]ETA05223.1 abortive infection protein [Gordonia alkanivorans CGMCC 6845]WJG15772.1 CPBP family intramembrane metalloprotease [Gordonia sp. Swx-4]